MAEEKDQVEKKDEGQAPKKSVFKWIFLTVILLVLVMGAYFGWALFVKGGERA